MLCTTQYLPSALLLGPGTYIHRTLPTLPYLTYLYRLGYTNNINNTNNTPNNPLIPTVINIEPFFLLLAVAMLLKYFPLHI